MIKKHVNSGQKHKKHGVCLGFHLLNNLKIFFIFTNGKNWYYTEIGVKMSVSMEVG